MKNKARYIDKFGELEASIENDSWHVTLEISGTKFISRNLDDFKIDFENEGSDRFTLNSYRELTNCRLIFSLPIITIYDDVEIQNHLMIDLNLDDWGQTYLTYVIISIDIDGNKILSNKVQSFEGVFETLMKRLPSGYKLKCCYFCAFADYSVFGQGFFGTMKCFKNVKADYLKVKDKNQYMDLIDNFDRNVQETFVCCEFETRMKGTGYRG